MIYSLLIWDDYPLVIPAGFEPATFGAEIRNSIQLNYGTISTANIGVVLKYSCFWSTSRRKNIPFSYIAILS